MGGYGKYIGTAVGLTAGIILGPSTFGLSVYAGAALGASIGSLAGSIVDIALPATAPKQDALSQKNVQDLSITSAALGGFIPIVRGRAVVPGNVIDATLKVPHEVEVDSGDDGESRGGGGGKGGYGGSAKATMTTTYSITLDIGLCEGPIVRISRVWTDLTLVYDETQATNKFSVVTYGDTGLKSGLRSSDNCTEIHVFLGGEDQLPSSIFQDVHGSDVVQAYRGLAHVVIKDLDLSTSGRVPQFLFEVVQSDALSLRGAVTELCTRSGLNPALVSVSGLSDAFINFIITNVVAINTILEGLLVSYNFIAVESDGILKFKDRTTVSSVAIPERMLSGSINTQSNTSLTIVRAQDIELPTKVTVTYPDPDRRFQNNSQVAQLINTVRSTDSAFAINVPVALTSTQAINLAEVLLYDAWSSRERFSFTLPPRYMILEPGDVVDITARGLNYRLRILEWTSGDNWIGEVKGISFDSSIHGGFHAAPSSPGPSNTPLALIARASALLIEIPAFRSTDVTPRFLFAPYSTETTKKFVGAVLFESTDGGASYNYKIDASVAATVGVVAIALPTVADTTVWDDTNTLSVVIYQNALHSLPDADVFRGGNFVLLGSEIIGFGTATLTGVRTYTLSHLRRGLRGTEAYVGTHGASENFVLLSSLLRSRGNVPYQLANIGVSRSYKVLDPTINIVSAGAFSYAPTGVSIKPWAPTLQSIVRNSPNANDIVVRWLARSRLMDANTGLPSAWDVDSSHIFVVKIYSSSSYATVLRSINTGVISTAISTILSQLYTATQQVTDFGSVQATIYYGIYALGNGVDGQESRGSG